MPLEPTFALTPRNSYVVSSNPNYNARLPIFGADIFPNYNENFRYSFEHQYAEDELYFHNSFAADPMLDYTDFSNRKKAPHVQLFYNLSSLGANKELALIFGFDAVSESRLLIFSNAGLLDDEILNTGDNQFLIEIESLNSLNLYFIHSQRAGSSYGGNWFFKGITGYVV